MFEELKTELARAYKAFGPIRGWALNMADIDFWEKMKWVNKFEADELRRLNTEYRKR